MARVDYAVDKVDASTVLLGGLSSALWLSVLTRMFKGCWLSKTKSPLEWEAVCASHSGGGFAISCYYFAAFVLSATLPFALTVPTACVVMPLTEDVNDDAVPAALQVPVTPSPAAKVA